MNKTLLLAGAALSIVAFNANALEFNPYAAARLSYARANIDYSQSVGDDYRSSDLRDNVWGGKIAAGVATPITYGTVRAELEYAFSQKAKANFTDAETAANGGDANLKGAFNTYMLNAYYDIDTGTKFTPYVSAGLGVTHIKAEGNYVYDGKTVSSFSKSKNNFAWQIGAGASYAVNDKVSVDLGYRYTDTGSVKGLATLDGSDDLPKIKTDSNIHEILLGARYSF